MKYVFVDESWEDYLYWQNTDKKKLRKINELLKDIARNPFDGMGKPEPLKHKYSGFWSRRIDDEHRLIYKYEDKKHDYLEQGNPEEHFEFHHPASSRLSALVNIFREKQDKFHKQQEAEHHQNLKKLSLMRKMLRSSTEL